MTLTTGSFLVGFIQRLGGSDAWINLLAAIPSLLGVLQIPGAILGRSFSGYKRFVLPGGLLWRIFYVALVFLPLLPLGDRLKLFLLAGCVAVAAAAVLFVNPIYNDWLAELVPSSARGWYFGRRHVIASAVGAVAGFIGGIVLDAFRGADMPDQGFSTVFGLGIACAAVSFLAFVRMKDVPRENPVREPPLRALKSMAVPWRDANFRSVLVFLAVFTLGQAFAGNLFSAFALESLEMSFTVLQLAAGAHALGTVMFTPIWGYLADKYGNRPMLFLFCIGITLTPAMWLFCFPGRDLENALILVPGHVFSGAMWGGALLCQLNLMLATADKDDRASYLGLGLALQAVVGGLAPLAGGELMTHLRGAMDAANAYKAIFVAAMGFRFAAIVSLLPVREPGSIRIREALRHLRKVTPKGYAALRLLARSESPERRESAIRSAGIEKMSMASDEVIAALHDPSPGVRREAAAALASLGDLRAVDALLHQLADHADLVEEEMIETLGMLRDERAAEPLLDQLRSPRANLRRTAAVALGRIGSPVAIPPLLEAAGDPSDPDLQRASLQALRKLRATESVEVAARALLDPKPSVRIAAAELVSELGMAEAAHALRESLERFRDEAESEVAYALGAVGEASDIPLILSHAARSESVITRRRCLLGVARLLRVEREAYRLLMAEGFARDGALLETLKPAMKRHRWLRSAVERYSSGDEKGALEALAKAHPHHVVAEFAERPVDELFLIAAVILASGR